MLAFDTKIALIDSHLLSCKKNINDYKPEPIEEDNFDEIL
jgi:hypothetical protein